MSHHTIPKKCQSYTKYAYLKRHNSQIEENLQDGKFGMVIFEEKKGPFKCKNLKNWSINVLRSPRNIGI